MYVKVHKIGDQWFRDDNKSLVGFELSHDSYVYRYLSLKTGKHTFLRNGHKKDIILVYYGYFNEYGKFIRFKDSELDIDAYKHAYVFVPEWNNGERLSFSIIILF